VREETGHTNTGDGRIAEREYTSDIRDDRAPFHTHECPGCQFVGCHVEGRTRYDLYFCTTPADSYPVSVVARCGGESQNWVRGSYAHHVGRTSGVPSTRALIRAADLAFEQGLVPLSYGSPLELEVGALLDLAVGESGAEGRRAFVVYQAPGSSINALQLNLAATAAGRRSLRTLVVFRSGERDDLEPLRALAQGFDRDVTTGILQEEGDAESQARAFQITLASATAFDRLLGLETPLVADLFDIVVVGQGFADSHAETLRRVGAHFGGARLLLLWTAIPPATFPGLEATTTGDITVYDAERLRARGGERDAATPDLFAGYPLSEPGGERSEWLARLPDAYRLGGERTSCRFDLGFAFTWRPGSERAFDYPYDGLPPLDELKAARVLAVRRAAGEGADEANRLLEESKAEAGMYIQVPRDFPDQCEVRPTAFGLYARHLADGALHTFQVWPAPYLRAAEERYAREREEGNVSGVMVGARIRQHTPFGVESWGREGDFSMRRFFELDGALSHEREPGVGLLFASPPCGRPEPRMIRRLDAPAAAEHVFQERERVRPSGLGRTAGWSSDIEGTVRRVESGAVYVEWDGVGGVEDNMLPSELVSLGEFAAEE
jgi:hypothetical protein